MSEEWAWALAGAFCIMWIMARLEVAEWKRVALDALEGG